MPLRCPRSHRRRRLGGQRVAVRASLLPPVYICNILLRYVTCTPQIFSSMFGTGLLFDLCCTGTWVAIRDRRKNSGTRHSRTRSATETIALLTSAPTPLIHQKLNPKPLSFIKIFAPCNRERCSESPLGVQLGGHIVQRRRHRCPACRPIRGPLMPRTCRTPSN